MKANIFVTLKQGVLDPQGQAAHNALSHLGFDGVSDVRLGKFIELTLNETNENDAKQAVESMCQKLLANTVVENYRFELAPLPKK